MKVMTATQKPQHGCCRAQEAGRLRDPLVRGDEHLGRQGAVRMGRRRGGKGCFRDTLRNGGADG